MINNEFRYQLRLLPNAPRPQNNAPSRSQEVRQPAVTPGARQINVGDQDGQPADQQR
jgi:hypothetical protein